MPFFFFTETRKEKKKKKKERVAERSDTCNFGVGFNSASPIVVSILVTRAAFLGTFYHSGRSTAAVTYSFLFFLDYTRTRDAHYPLAFDTFDYVITGHRQLRHG